MLSTWAVEVLVVLEEELVLDPMAELAMFVPFPVEFDPVPAFPVLMVLEAAISFLLELELALAVPMFGLPADEFELADV